MTPTMCSRCGKNVAVVFITKIENGQTKNEGLCLKCARELHIKPVDDVIEKMGISDEDLPSPSSTVSSAAPSRTARSPERPRPRARTRRAPASTSFWTATASI